MIRLRTVLVAAVATWGTSLAAAQIVPQPGTEPVPPSVQPEAQLPANAPIAGTERLQDSFSLGDLEGAFKAAGLQVAQKIAPNGLQYLEARKGGDLIFGAALACAGANASRCQTLMLQSGSLDRTVSYEDMMRFSAGGYSSHAVTFDAVKRNPSLMQVTHVYGRFDDKFLAGSVQSMIGDMQAFLQGLQQQSGGGQGFSAATPEGRISGSFTGDSFAAGSLPLPTGAK